MLQEKGDGDWHMILTEYTISPNWFLQFKICIIMVIMMKKKII